MPDPIDLAAITAFADEVRVSAHERDAAGDYPDDLVQRMRALGLFGACVGDLRSYARAMEEVGRAWLSLVPIVNAHSTSVWVLKTYGNTAQQDQWLDALRNGTTIACLALTEPHAGSDLASVRSEARPAEGGWRLDLHKTLITHSDHADHMLVLARTQAGPASTSLSLFLLDRPQWTVVRRLPKLGTVSIETCEISAADVFVPADRLVGVIPGSGYRQILDALEVGRIAVAAAAVGVARSALWTAVDRIREREAFGAPLAENAIVQQRVATMTTRIAAAKGLVLLAADRKNAGGRHDVETSAAKIVATEAALQVSLTAMELGGGMGYTEDLDFARHLRDAALFLAGEGANSLLESLVGARTVRSSSDPEWV